MKVLIVGMQTTRIEITEPEVCLHRVPSTAVAMVLFTQMHAGGDDPWAVVFDTSGGTPEDAFELIRFLRGEDYPGEILLVVDGYTDDVTGPWKSYASGEWRVPNTYSFVDRTMIGRTLSGLVKNWREAPAREEALARINASLPNGLAPEVSVAENTKVTGGPIWLRHLASQ